MSELNDAAQQEEPEFEPRSRTVSFPDHYLLPYIERCKNSRRITCGCSLMFIGLAIFCFFATNYMVNYPVTEARKIAFVFAAVFCLVAAGSCLNLRFRIFNSCRNEPDNDTLFEMARREDTVFSDSFSGHFEMPEPPCGHGTPKEGSSQAETPYDSFTLVQSADESNSARISALRYNGRGRLPRHSISDDMSPHVPLIPPQRAVELSSSSSGRQNGTNSKRLQIGESVPGSNSYPLNYSTFQNRSVALETEPLLAKSTFDNGCDSSESEPLLAKSTFDNGCDSSESEPLMAESTFENGCGVYKTELLLTESSFENGSIVSETEPLLAEPFKND